MHSITAVLALLASTAVHAAPNKNGVEFLFPPDNSSLTLNYLDTIVVTYNSPFDNPLLYTFCTNVSNTKDLIQSERFHWIPALTWRIQRTNTWVSNRASHKSVT